MTKNYDVYNSHSAISTKRKLLGTSPQTTAKSGSEKSFWKASLIFSFFLLAVLTQGVFAQASIYNFTQNNGTYDEITGGTVIRSSTNGTPSLDSYVSGILPMPSFNFAGATYTQMYVTSNGQISLGPTAPVGYTYTVLSATTGGNVFLAPFSADLNSRSTGVSEIRYETIGDELIVQWDNFQRYGVTESISFQVRMNIVTGVIKFVYDGTPPYGTATTYQPQVGIKSAIGVYNALTVAAGGNWNSPSNITSGIASNSTAAFSGNVGPTSGLTYTFTPGIAVAPNCAINFAPVDSAVNVARNPTLTWQSGGGNATTYDVYFGSTATPTFIGNQVAASYTPVAPLAINTTYYWKVVPKNTTGEGTGCVVNSFTTGSSIPYCIPASTSSETFINNFSTTLGSTNISNASGYTTGGYQDNYANGAVTSIPTGQFNYALAVTGGTLGAAIWVDWNSDGTFGTTERVFVTTAYGSGPYSGSISIPAGTATGDYRMRVMVDYNASAPSNPCNTTGARTETEDYKISVGAQNLCSGAPAAATIASVITTICVSGSTTITATIPPSTDAGFTYQWYDNSGAIVGATTTSYTTPILSSPNSYYLKTICTNSGLSTDSNTLAIAISQPSVVSTTPATRCGIGSVNLGATVSAGASAIWFAAATGGAPLFTGETFATPSISETTTYYVAASEGATAESAAKASSTGIDGSFVFANYGIVFNSSVNATLASTVIYPTGTGTVTLALYDSAGVELATTSAIAVTGSGIATPVTVPLNFSVTPGTGYRLLLKAYTGITGLVRDFTNVFPYNSTNTSVTAGWTGSTSTAYYFFYNLQVTTGCASARTAVVATVSAPAALTLSAESASLCTNESTSAIMLTAGASDYDTFVWSPTTGVTGSATTGYIFNPSVSTNYTLTVTNTVSGCSNVANFNVTVNPLPALAVTPLTATACAGGPATLLTASPASSGSVAIGTGSTTNATYGYPSPFTNFYGGTKHQLLFRASELTALGFIQGDVITEVAINVASVASGFSGSLSGFSLAMGHTSVNTLTSSAFISGLTTVRVAANLAVPTTGLPSNVNIPFDNNFIWDGTSNLVIQTSYSTNDGGSGDVYSSYTDPGFSSINYFRADEQTPDTILGTTVPTGSSNNRTNIIITKSNVYDFTWSPISNLFTDAAATIPYTGGNSAIVYAKSATAGSQVYTATATIPTTGCSATATTTITTTTTDAPTALAQSFCGGSTVADLVATGTAVKWYSAETGGTALANTAALATGTYYVSQTVSACESTRTSVAITVNVTAEPVVAAQTFCNAATVADLMATGTAIQWYAEQTGGVALANTAALATGTYYVSQTENSCESVRASVSVTVSITAAPTASAQTVCSGSTVADLVATGTDIQWYSALTGGTALANTTVLAAGTYYASQTENICESTRTSVEVTVNGLPTATITRVDDTLTVYEANATYQWVLCGDTQTPIAGATSQTFTATTAGSYAVIVTSQNGCTATSECFEIATLSTKSFDAAKLGYYPNPVTDVLTVSHTDIISSLQVFDITGRIVRNLKVNANEVTVDMANMPAAVYIVKVFTDSTSGEFKVVKK